MELASILKWPFFLAPLRCPRSRPFTARPYLGLNGPFIFAISVSTCPSLAGCGIPPYAPPALAGRPPTEPIQGMEKAWTNQLILVTFI